MRGEEESEFTLRTTPAQPDPTTSYGEALHPLNGSLGVNLSNELDEATAFTGRDLDLKMNDIDSLASVAGREGSEGRGGGRKGTNVSDLSERGEERLEGILRDEAAQSTNEDGRVVGIRRVYPSSSSSTTASAPASRHRASMRVIQAWMAEARRRERAVEVLVRRGVGRRRVRERRDGRERRLSVRAVLLVARRGIDVVGQGSAAVVVGRRNVEAARDVTARGAIGALLLLADLDLEGRERDLPSRTERESPSVCGRKLREILDGVGRETSSGGRDSLRRLLLRLLLGGAVRERSRVLKTGVGVDDREERGDGAGDVVWMVLASAELSVEGRSSSRAAVAD
jgi:hypothetical protein